MLHAITFMALSLGAPPDAAVKKRAEALVARLGSPSYRDRELAARELIEIGFAVRDAVLAGQKSPDPEIRERCTQLYPVIWRADLERRVKRFLDAPDASIPDDLPGAARWVEVAGDGKESRRLYATMVRAHHEQLLEVDLHPARLADVYLDFLRGVRSHGASAGPGGRVGPGDSDVLLFLFLGAVGETRPARRPGISSTSYSQFLSAPFLTAALSADPPDVPFRRLYAGWLAKERYSIAVRRGIDVAAQHKVHECAPAILKIVADRDTIASVRAAALMGFGRLGTKDDIPALDSLLKDDLQIAITSLRQRGTIQMRDVALAAAVHLAGQNPQDFGFERKIPAGATSVSYIYCAFASDEKRAAAHAKWKEWATENLKK